MVQGEKAVSTLEVVGFMMNLPPELQVDVEKGQQFPLKVQEEVQSWIAPKLISAMSILYTHPWPISCATKDHSVCKAVETPVPDTTDPCCLLEPVWQTVPSHATPTS